MTYLDFALGFTFIHAVAYTVAGALSLRISADVYREKARVLDFLRDMSDPAESRHVTRWFFPAQLVRGPLMAVVLFPVLGPLGELSFGLRFAFLAGLMFVYTHVAAAAPSADNLEGFVYLKPRYLQRRAFAKLHLEMVLYSVLFAGPAAWLLF